MTAPSSIVVGVDVPSPDPDCGIDYERLGSLPMGVPPALLLRSTLKEWIAAMAAKAAVFTFARPADDGLDPQRPTALRVAQIANLNAALTGVANVIVRRSLGVGAPTQIALSAPKVDAVGRRGAVPPTSTARATWYGALDSSFPWDDSARAASAVPLPCLTDETMLVHWASEADSNPPPPLPASLIGVFDTVGDAQASYLLTTHSGDNVLGEIDPTLLRAPHPGQVRFERYRHLGLDAGGNVKVLHRSNAGRLLFHGSPLNKGADGHTPLDTASHSPWLNGLDVCYENVDAASLAPHLAALAWDQLVHLETLLSTPRFRRDTAMGKALESAVSRLLQSWRAWLELRAFVGGLSADIASVVSGAQAAVPLTPVPLSGRALKNAATAVLGDTQLRGNLQAFAVGMYAPLLTGDVDVDLLVPRDKVIDTAFASAHAVEQGILLALLGGPAPWLPVFAGAPLGRAATVYSVNGAVPGDPGIAARTGLFTADLEALWLSGATAMLAGAPAPLNPSASASRAPLELTPFAALEVGRLCAIRLVSSAPAFTSRDWLDEMSKGCTRLKTQPPLFDAWDLAAAAHPLLLAVDWPLALAGWGLREQMNLLSDVVAPFGGTDRTLGPALAKWWETNLAVTVSGNWPWIDFTSSAGGIKLDPPSPQMPYSRASTVATSILHLGSPPPPVVHVRHRAETLTFPKIAGFDDQDFEVALAVTRVVNNGADLSQAVELPIVLALMERESYRAQSARRRGREGQALDLSNADPIFLPGATPASDIPAVYQGRSALARFGARLVWAAQHYGADRLCVRQPIVGLEVTDREFCRTADTTLRNILAEFTTPDANGQSLLAPAFIASLDVRRFLDDRLRFSFPDPAATAGSLSVLSPRLQFVGVALQQALFQWFHRKLVLATGAAGDYRPVAEYIAAAPPLPGTSANSIERRDYIAYYACAYLAYNTASGPNEWNFWMERAETSRGAEPASTWVLFEGKPAGMSNIKQAQIGHLARFALALDGYQRLDLGGGVDTADPFVRSGWDPVVP